MTLSYFKAGAQVCADAQVCAGEVQVNESLLTGESDEITKHAGDQTDVRKFYYSGQCHARLDKVGEDSYISKLTLEAKEMQNGEQSEMIRSLDKLVKCVGVAIIRLESYSLHSLWYSRMHHSIQVLRQW